MKKMLCFDMDGTIADLYGIPDWQNRLFAQDETPYMEARPLCNMEQLRETLLILSAQGWGISVISWASRGGDKEYIKRIAKAKRAWLKKYQFPADEVHIVKYGTTKADCIRRKNLEWAVLFDDNEKVCKGWESITNNRIAVNVKNWDLLEMLKMLVVE